MFLRRAMGVLAIGAAGMCVALGLRSYRERLLWTYFIGDPIWVAVEIHDGTLSTILRFVPGKPSMNKLSDSIAHGRDALLVGDVTGKTFGCGWRTAVRTASPRPSGPGKANLERAGAKVGEQTCLWFPYWICPVVLLLLPLLTFARVFIRRYLRRKKGWCPACGYNLFGNISGVCPECGSHIIAQPYSCGTSLAYSALLFILGYYIWLELVGGDNLDGIIVTWPKGLAWHRLVWYCAAPLPPFILSLIAYTALSCSRSFASYPTDHDMRRADLRTENCDALVWRKARLSQFAGVMAACMAVLFAVRILDEILVWMLFGALDPLRVRRASYLLLALLPAYSIGMRIHIRLQGARPIRCVSTGNERGTD